MTRFNGFSSDERATRDRPIYEHLFDKRAIESLQGAAKGLLEAFR